MGGSHGIRGYLIQSIVTVLDSLDEDNEWDKVCLEPDDESEKVDIRWIYQNKNKKLSQVKSSQNPIHYSNAESWAKELKDGAVADSYELILVGYVDSKLHNSTKINDVDLVKKPLDFDALNAIALNRIETFYSRRDKGNITPEVRKLLVSNLTYKLSEDSIFSKELTKIEFDKTLMDWFLSIEKQVLQNPYSQLVEANNNIQKVSVGQEIVKNVLKLLGWERLNINEEVEEYNEQKGELETFRVDFSAIYNSRLKDNEKDYLVIQSKLESEYPSSTKREVIDQVINLNKVTDKIIQNSLNTSDENKSIFNILFWLSMKNEELSEDFIFSVKPNFKPTVLAKDTYYFLVDNAKANFLISSIITAKNFRQNLPVKFLYPITEENSSPQKIGKRGFQLPPQYINSSILQLIKEDKEKISILLFCSDAYSPDNLKKVIWLIVKLSSGFANEYVIYFPDYDIKHQNEVNNIIRSFDDELLFDRISVEKLKNVEFSQLGNLPQIEQPKSSKEEFDESQQSGLMVNQIFKDHLPYGDLIKPFLKTEKVSAQDLQIFLASKGIFLRSADKKQLIHLMTSLLYSPDEIENFIKLINAKDRPLRAVPYFLKATTELSVPDLFKRVKVNFDDINDGLSARLIDPVIFKPDKNDPDTFLFKSHVECKDPTKHIAISTSWNPLQISYKKEGDKIIVNSVETNSKEAKIIANRITDKIKQGLINQNLVEDEVVKVMFDSFDRNKERVNFLLSFTSLSNTRVFIDQDIKSIKYTFDESQVIPEKYIDKKEKDLIFLLRGKNLSGLNEMSEEEFKNIIFLEEINISYKFTWKTVQGYYNVKFNFSDALKIKPIPNGLFRSEPSLYLSSYIKRNVTNIAELEGYLKKELERIKLENIKKFNKL